MTTEHWTTCIGQCSRSSGGTRMRRDNVTALTASSPYVEKIDKAARIPPRIRGVWLESNAAASTDTLADLVPRGLHAIGPSSRPAATLRRRSPSTRSIRAAGTTEMLCISARSTCPRGLFERFTSTWASTSEPDRRGCAYCTARPLVRSRQCNHEADMGFGISRSSRSAGVGSPGRKGVSRSAAPMVAAIEQPELHLHPHHQFQLADMFVSLTGSVLNPDPPLSLHRDAQRGDDSPLR